MTRYGRSMSDPVQQEPLLSVEELVEQSAAALRWAAWRGFSHVELQSLEPIASRSASSTVASRATPSSPTPRQGSTTAADARGQSTQAQDTPTPEASSRADSHAQQCPHCQIVLTSPLAAGEARRAASEVMVLVDAPMEIDAKGHRRVSGEGGELLAKMLGAIGLSGAQIYVSASYHCFGSDSDAGSLSAQDHRQFLHLELNKVQPKVLLVMGQAAAKRAFDKSLEEVIGWWERVSHVHATATWDPASLLEQPDRKRQAWEDLKQLRKRLGQRATS